MRFLLLPLLLLSVTAQAQILPAIGTDATFDIATWNIERFGEGSGDTQFNNALAVISQGDVDLWALQEVNDRSDFDALVDALGEGWDSAWTNGTGSLGYAFIFRTAVVQDLQATTILTNESFNFASRPPLLLRANLTLPSGTVENVRFINVHAKCCGDQSSYNRRVAASEALKNYVDNFLTIDAPIIVLGDLNDELRSSIFNGTTSPYQNFRDDEDDYRFLTEILDLADAETFCSNNTCTSGSTLDHILLTRPIENLYVEGSMNRFDEVLDGIPNYVSSTSDHIPVYARFDFGLMTDAEDETLPQPFALRAPFPNPFRTATTLTYTLPAPTDVRLDVFDALGRRVATVAEGTQPAGLHEVEFAGGALRPGLYIARLSAEGQTATRRLVLLP